MKDAFTAGWLGALERYASLYIKAFGLLNYLEM
jgi:hypothetical protein